PIPKRPPPPSPPGGGPGGGAPGQFVIVPPAAGSVVPTVADSVATSPFVPLLATSVTQPAITKAFTAPVSSKVKTTFVFGEILSRPRGPSSTVADSSALVSMVAPEAIAAPVDALTPFTVT